MNLNEHFSKFHDVSLNAQIDRALNEATEGIDILSIDSFESQKDLKSALMHKKQIKMKNGVLYTPDHQVRGSDLKIGDIFIGYTNSGKFDVAVYKLLGFSDDNTKLTPEFKTLVDVKKSQGVDNMHKLQGKIFMIIKDMSVGRNAIFNFYAGYWRSNLGQNTMSFYLLK